MFSSFINAATCCFIVMHVGDGGGAFYLSFVIYTKGFMYIRECILPLATRFGHHHVGNAHSLHT